MNRALNRKITLQSVWCAGILVFFLVIIPLGLGRSYLGFDTLRVDWGSICELRAAIRSGGGFLLSQFMGNGLPLLADSSTQLFYPPRWIAVFLPLEVAMSFSILFHLTLAAIGAAWLARTFQLKRTSSICVGLIFSLSGPVLDLLRHAFYLTGAAWLPMIWAATRRTLESRHPQTAFVILSLSLAACLLGSDPQSFMVGCGIFLCEGLARGRVKRFGVLVIAGGIGICLGLLQWSATFTEMKNSFRFPGLRVESALKWSFDPLGWLSSIWPWLIHPGHDGSFSLWEFLENGAAGRGAAAGFQPPWNQSPYVGPLFLGAAVAGLFLKKARSAAIVFSLGLILAVGDRLPILPWLVRHISLFSIIRYPSKYLVITALAGSILAGAAIESAVRSKLYRRRLFFSLSVLLVFQGLAFAWIKWSQTSIDLTTSILLETTYLISESVLHSIVQASVPLLIGVYLLRFFPTFRSWVPLLMIYDLLVAAPQAVDLGNRVTQIHSPLAELGAIYADPPIFCMHPALAGRKDLSGQTPVESSVLFMKKVALPNLNACDGVVMATSYSPLQSPMFLMLSEGLRGYSAAAARAMGCTHFIGEFAPKEGSPAAIHFPGQERLLISEIADPVPRVFVSRDPVVVDRLQLALDRFYASRTAGDVLKVIDDPEMRLRNLAKSANLLPDGKGVTHLDFDWPVRSRARVDISGSGGAVIGLRTAYASGWHAVQAGRELAVLRASGSHPAAVVRDVRAGPVFFEYRWPKKAEGILCFTIGVLVLLGAYLQFGIYGRLGIGKRLGFYIRAINNYIRCRWSR